MIIKKYIDVQKLASKQLKTTNGTIIGLRSSVEFLNIPIRCDFHNAFYTTEIFKKLYCPDIDPITYNKECYSKRIVEPKKNVDTESLLNQFEKMYNREMTDDEKSIIKLSYIMGKTNQFLR